MNNNYINNDEWLSNILGKPSYKIDKLTINIDKNFKKNSFYYFKNKTNDSKVTKLLKKFNFEFIQNDLILKTEKIIVDKKLSTLNCRYINIEENIDLDYITDNSFYYSRFYSDKKIRKNKAKIIKRKWVNNFFDNKRGDKLIGYFIDKKIVGYLLIKINNQEIIIDLIAVNKNYRRKNISTKMIFYLSKHFKNYKFKVGTQILNRASLMLYLKLGFKINNFNSIYHLHT